MPSAIFTKHSTILKTGKKRAGKAHPLLWSIPHTFSGLSHTHSLVYPTYILWSIPHTFSGLSHTHSLVYPTYILWSIRCSKIHGLDVGQKRSDREKGERKQEGTVGWDLFSFVFVPLLYSLEFNNNVWPARRAHSLPRDAHHSGKRIFHMPHYAVSVALFKWPAPIFPPSFLIIFARQQQRFIGSSWWSLSWKRE